ncbi:MAG: hypothetical protein KDA44_12125 [Planctomycetales bacterium]|nr:hypothetical protein [Planctomycetales bacterium]
MLRQFQFVTRVLLVMALAAGQARAITTLFSDSFDRTDNRDIDAETTGIVNNTGTVFAASDVYSQPFLDPNNAAPTFGVQDGVAANGGGAQILSNQLQLAVGSGTSNAFVNHNFTNAAILADGGFRVSVDVAGTYGGTSNGQGGAFAIGMTQAEALSAADAQDAATMSMTHAFGNTPTVISDFWMGIRGNSTIAWGSGNGTVNTAAVGAKGGTISAVFGASDFNAGSTVSYEVFFNGASQGVGLFQWSDTMANYIGLDARDGSQVSFDNFLIETAVPPPKPTLTINRDTGNITLKNLTNGPLSITAYSMITASGGLNQANWAKIESQGLDTNDEWITLTAVDSTTDLAEGTFGEYTIAAANAGTTDEINFGNAWRRSPFEDIAFELRDAANNEVPTLVEYVGNGGVAYAVGDLSLNGTLDAADWTILRSNLSSDVSALAQLDGYFAGDLTGDGLVDLADYREFKAIYIAANGPNSFAALARVPEPSAIGLALLAGGFVAAGRRRRCFVTAIAVLAAVVVLTLPRPAQAVDLFVDTFDRADSRDIDATTTGITNNTGTAFAASEVYTTPYVDPNNVAPTYGVEDADAGNGGGIQVLSNGLQLAVGAGTSNAFVNHNFTNGVIVTDGGFRVSLDVGAYTQASTGQGGAFAIGMSSADALTAGDAFGGHAAGDVGTFGPKMQDAFENAGAASEGTVISDFWVALTGSNTLIWGGFGDENVLGSANVGAKTGTISAEFAVTDFNAGSTVSYQVYYNGASQGAGSFQWSRTNENYIGLDARDSMGVTLDNFRIESVAGLTSPLLKLVVDAGTGAASIVAGGSANALDSYEITSAGGGLLAGNFNGIRGDNGLPAGDGSGNGWEIAGSNSSMSLIETYLLGESTIAANSGQLSLGSIFDTGSAQDLAFTYYDANGNPTVGLVEYVTSSLPDFNSDGKVNGSDFLTWQRNVGTGTTFAQGDANGDSMVNGVDLALWESSFGAGAAVATAGAVPEPGAVVLLLVACELLTARCQRRRQAT